MESIPNQHAHVTLAEEIDLESILSEVYNSTVDSTMIPYRALSITMYTMTCRITRLRDTAALLYILYCVQ